MKNWFLCVLLSLGNLIASSQLSYKELTDLNTLCKKEDFEAAKTFLTNKGYVIESDKGSYDHGSYFVHAEIEATKKIGSKNNPLLRGTDYENIYDVIEIQFLEYQDEKDLTIYQSIQADHEYYMKFRKMQPIYDWVKGNWTRVLVKDQELWKEIFPEKYDSIQAEIRADRQGYFIKNLNNAYSEWTLELGDKTGRNTIDKQLLASYLSKHEFKENENFEMNFYNMNPEYGDITRYHIQYVFDQKKEIQSYSTSDSVIRKYYSLNLSLNTELLKGRNIIDINAKLIKFPLMQKGHSYILKIKFGKIIKTYILDSGASDMSIDTETFQYLNNTNQLKIENRLSDARYQLADGSIVQFKRVRIPSFSINDVTVKDIDATIVQNGKPLLLGKSFLDSFKSWKIDNVKNVLVLETF